MVISPGKISAGDEVPNADKLDPVKRLSRYFPEPPVEEMIHLVVQLPLGGRALISLLRLTLALHQVP